MLVRSIPRCLSLALLAFATPPAAAATDFKVHGLLDVVAAERGLGYATNVLTRGDNPYDAYGVRLLADARVSERLTVFGQMMLRDATAPYVDGAYAMYTPSAAHDLHLLAGKVPWAIGTWGPRTYSDHNPLIGVPLLYQYHSSLVWYDVPGDADALLHARGTGQTGVDYYGYAMGRGMPIVDDCYWDVGATLAGSARPLEYALGVNAGTPGWGSTSEDENSGKSYLGRLGIAPLPGLRFGVSGAYGAYLHDKVNPELPTGKRATDYHQRLGMADLEVLVGRAELRSEAALNVWESPALGDLRATSGYAELKYALPFGGFVAGRYDVLRFGEITSSTGASVPWDADVTRLEAGAGYRFDRNVLAKVVWQRSTVELDVPGRDDPAPTLVAAQLSVAF